MKTKAITLLICFLLLCPTRTFAQLGSHWSVLGNNLTTTGFIGSNNGFNVVFRSNGFERGRLTTAGLWGFGTIFPSAKVQINSIAGQNPFRVQVASATKFTVSSLGKTGIGVFYTSE